MATKAEAHRRQQLVAEGVLHPTAVAREQGRCRTRLGKLIAAEAKGPVSFFVPLKGFSHHDSPEGHLHDPSLCPVFATALKKALPASVDIREFDCHINDPQFADAIVAQVLALTGKPQAKGA